jgi:hypothetical protein
MSEGDSLYAGKPPFSVRERKMASEIANPLRIGHQKVK